MWPPLFLALSRSTQPEYHIHSSRLQGQSQHVFRVYSSSLGRQLRHCCCFCFLFKEKLIGPVSKLMVLCLNIMLFKTTLLLLLLSERFLGCLCKNKWRSDVSRKAKLSCLVPGSSTSRTLERLWGSLCLWVPMGGGFCDRAALIFPAICESGINQTEPSQLELIGSYVGH